MAETTQWIGLTMENYGEFYKSDVEWLWYPWIPKGHLTMIAGHEDVGKSFLAAYIIAMIGGYQKIWPDGSPGPEDPGWVLCAEYEQMVGVYFKRLGWMGMDQANQNIIFGPRPVGNEFETVRLDDPLFLDVLEAFVAESEVHSVIIDSLSGGHDKSENKDAMRSLLNPLMLMASRLNVAVIILHHFRKNKSTDSGYYTLDSVRGHSSITQFCRSVILIWKELGLEGEKTNNLFLNSAKHTFVQDRPTRIRGSFSQNGFNWSDASKLDLTIVDGSDRKSVV